MITKFDTYKLNENKIFLEYNFSNNVINFLYDKFKIDENNLRITKSDKVFGLYDIVKIKNYLFNNIIISDDYIFYVGYDKNYTVYNISTKEYYNSILDILSDLEDNYFYVVSIRLFTYDDFYPYVNNLIDEQFKSKYSIIFQKIFKQYLNDVKNEYLENINNIDDFNNDASIGYIEEMKIDLKYLTRYSKDDVLSNRNIEYSIILLDVLKNEYNCNIFISKENINFKKLLKRIKDNEDIFINKIAIYTFKKMIENFSYIRQRELDEKINKNLKRYSDLKQKLTNPKIINKWKHLDNAENFDLI